MADDRQWPDIPYAQWAETCQALHLYSQMVGKYRLARAPWVNHSWHATLYVNATGLTTGVVPDSGIGIELAFDLVDHRLVGTNSAGDKRDFSLEPGTVAGFSRHLKQAIAELGGTAEFHGSPNEVEDAVAFERDDWRRPYDRDAVTRFHRALVSIDAVFKKFRTGFIGKVSPVHLFWGSFDLAVTRFSGRTGPPHPGGVPNLPDTVTREAYSHEVSSAGFWPGGGGIDEPTFYSYAYPTPADFPIRASSRGRRTSTKLWVSSCCLTQPGGDAARVSANDLRRSRGKRSVGACSIGMRNRSTGKAAADRSLIIEGRTSRSKQ